MVRLLGGPDDWHGKALEHLTAEELNGPREDLGAYLISDHVPPGMADPAARAVYSPDEPPDAPADVWCGSGGAGAWELCEAAGEWTAGPLPHVLQKHDDFDDLLD